MPAFRKVTLTYQVDSPKDIDQAVSFLTQHARELSEQIRALKQEKLRLAGSHFVVGDPVFFLWNSTYKRRGIILDLRFAGEWQVLLQYPVMNGSSLIRCWYPETEVWAEHTQHQVKVKEPRRRITKTNRIRLDEDETKFLFGMLESQKFHNEEVECESSPNGSDESLGTPQNEGSTSSDVCQKGEHVLESQPGTIPEPG